MFPKYFFYGKVLSAEDHEITYFSTRALKSTPYKMGAVKYSLLAVTVVIVLSNSCIKDEQIDSTGLKIRVIDEEGNSVPEVSVKLFKSLNDMENQINQLGSTRTSDANGEASFTDLDTIKYYWLAEKGCRNNIHGIITTDTLESGIIKVVTTTISETGTLELINQSASQYQVFINAAFLLITDPQSSYSYVYIPAGSYSIKVVQIDGPVIKTYTGNITCGNKLSVIFP
jgi:hypothetical protein